MGYADDFDLRALYEALDVQRRSRQLTWTAATDEISRRETHSRPIAVSTITGLKSARTAEGDGILQMLLWLRRTPESFVPGMTDPQSECFLRPRLTTGQVLRWDTSALYSALRARAQEELLTWAEVARQARGFTPGMLSHLAKGSRVGFPRIMRLVRWLGQPAADFTRVSNR